MTNKRLMTLLKKLFIEIQEVREIEYVLENIEMSKEEYEEVTTYEIPKTQEQIFHDIVYDIEEIRYKDNRFYKTYENIKQMIIIDYRNKSINLFNVDGNIPHDLRVDLEILKPLNFTITYHNFMTPITEALK